MTSDCESEMNGEDGEVERMEDGVEDINMENIRQLSQNITNKFGNR